jgi:CheY-like chemotaxis protein
MTMATILLVEDNEMNRDMLTRRLARRGYDVLHAGDGREAVGTALSGRPDLILMDLSLPEVDGLEATRRIKAHPDAQAIPVIALTAHAMLNDRERAIAAGCDDYDTKPIDLARLLDKIQLLLPKETR